jgi:hypothetical protein
MKRVGTLAFVIMFVLFSNSSFGQEDSIRSKRFFPYKILFKDNKSTFSKKEKRKFEEALLVTQKYYPQLKKENYIITLQPSGCEGELKDISLHIKRCKEIIKHFNKKAKEVIPIMTITFNYLPNCWVDCDEGCSDGVTIHSERLAE